jgi:CMP-N-acetylneuraminic acid synthetase
MAERLRVLGLIPARGGSKGVARKNARSLAGKPLLQYTAEAALAARRLDRVLLSTDDDEIAEIGRKCGIEVPFLRPAELARDDTPMLPVVQHALREREEHGERYDAVCLLQPTSPLRRAEHVDACIELLEQSGADAVVTVLPVPAEHHPYWVFFREPDGRLRPSSSAEVPTRRQDLPPAFHREGSVYVTRRDVVLEGGSLYGSRVLGYPVPPMVNIDTEDDWRRAEALLAGGPVLEP